MDYHKSNRPATKQKLAMRFFGSKHRKRDGQQALGEVETRTDDLGSREVSSDRESQPLTPIRKARQFALKSPSSRAQREVSTPRSRQHGGGLSSPSKAKARYNNDSSHSQSTTKTTNNNNRAATVTKQTPRSSPENVQSPSNNPGPKAKPTPPSILHKSHAHPNAGISSPLSPPPGPTFAMSPMPPVAAYNPNPRVRFMSSGESVASASEASGVHLMAGGANSVASSSAMSSSEGNRENVFDRVLNMVMAEEHERLNAMGMSRADPKRDFGANRWGGRHQHHTGDKSSPGGRFAQLGGGAAGEVAPSHTSANNGTSSEDMGLMPRRRGDLPPIDMDTGLEFGESNEAPIDLDTGMEIGATLGVHHKSPIDIDTGLEIQYDDSGGGGDIDYHDLNDDDIDETQWNNLNNSAMMGDVHEGMKGLAVDTSRRSRSYDSSRQPQPPHTLPGAGGGHHDRSLSSPPKYRRRGSNDELNNNKQLPSRDRTSGGKTVQKIWNHSEDFESNEWVVFDNQGPSSNNSSRTAPGRVSDLAAF